MFGIDKPEDDRMKKLRVSSLHKSKKRRIFSAR